MKREKALLHFHDNYGKVYGQLILLELEDYFQQHIDEFVPDFVETFRQLCVKIKTMQLQKEKRKIRYITYSLLKEAIKNRKPVYLIEASDQNWFLDPVECRVWYQPEWMVSFLDRLGSVLEEKRKPYFDRVTTKDVDHIKLTEAEKYHCYVVQLARYALPQAVELPEFREIIKDDVFDARIGEYLDISEVVYKEEQTLKDPVETKVWLEKRNGLEYTYEVFAGLNLTKGYYRGVNLSYANLKGSNLSGSLMQYCTLAGTKFQDCSLEGSDLNQSWIREADFHGCNLRGANLCEVVGGAGLPNREKWERPGYFRVNFTGADLAGANLMNADLRGANFTGANLIKANFAGANLDRAIFSAESTEILNLTEEQKTQIVWE